LFVGSALEAGAKAQAVDIVTFHVFRSHALFTLDLLVHAYCQRQRWRHGSAAIFLLRKATQRHLAFTNQWANEASMGYSRFDKKCTHDKSQRPVNGICSLVCGLVIANGQKLDRSTQGCNDARDALISDSVAKAGGSKTESTYTFGARKVTRFWMPLCFVYAVSSSDA